MIVKDFRDYPQIKKDIRPLFLSAFPEDERPPANIYFKNFKKDINQLFGFYVGDTFIGFASVTFYKDICYLFFLAVKEEQRDKGYGSKIISILKERFKDYVLLICYEEVDKKYPDYENRLRREKFYIRNGFIKNPLKTNEFGVIYQSAYIGSHTVSFEEYKEIFASGFGDYAVKFLSAA